MNTNKPKRPRIAKGTLISSSDDTYQNTIKAINRIREKIIVTYTPISYANREYAFANINA